MDGYDLQIATACRRERCACERADKWRFATRSSQDSIRRWVASTRVTQIRIAPNKGHPRSWTHFQGIEVNFKI